MGPRKRSLSHTSSLTIDVSREGRNISTSCPSAVAVVPGTVFTASGLRGLNPSSSVHVDPSVPLNDSGGNFSEYPDEDEAEAEERERERERSLCSSSVKARIGDQIGVHTYSQRGQRRWPANSDNLSGTLTLIKVSWETVSASSCFHFSFFLTHIIFIISCAQSDAEHKHRREREREMERTERHSLRGERDGLL